MFAMIASGALAALYHSVTPIVLPDSGQVAPSDYIAGMRMNLPHGLIVHLGPSGIVASVDAYGWSVFPNLSVHQTADINHDGFVTGDDDDLFRKRFEAGEITADYDGDQFVTGEDFDAFQHDFEAGNTTR